MVIFGQAKRHCATGGEAVRGQTRDDSLERGRGGAREGETRVRSLFAHKRGRPPTPPATRHQVSSILASPAPGSPYRYRVSQRCCEMGVVKLGFMAASVAGLSV